MGPASASNATAGAGDEVDELVDEAAKAAGEKAAFFKAAADKAAADKASTEKTLADKAAEKAAAKKKRSSSSSGESDAEASDANGRDTAGGEVAVKAEDAAKAEDAPKAKDAAKGEDAASDAGGSKSGGSSSSKSGSSSSSSSSSSSGEKKKKAAKKEAKKRKKEAKSAKGSALSGLQVGTDGAAAVAMPAADSDAEPVSKLSAKRSSAFGHTLEDATEFNDKQLAKAIEKEKKKRKTDKKEGAFSLDDERNRKFGGLAADGMGELSPEEFEAYRLQKMRSDDPMSKFL